MKLLFFTGVSALSVFNLFDATSDQALKLVGKQDNIPVPGNTPIEQCDADTKQLFQFTNVTLDPEIPEAGQNLTIFAAGELLDDVTEGAYVDIVASYGLITLVRQRYDLCDNLGEVDLECPVSPGPVEITKIVELPENIPPGQYTVLAKAYTAKDKLLSCVTATITLGF